MALGYFYMKKQLKNAEGRKGRGKTSLGPSFPRILFPAFTLMEMVVALAIFTLISTTVLANHSRFSNAVLLGNLAYDIALSIREAQVYGLSVRQASSGTFQAGYGVHFAAADLNSYRLFVDIDKNKRYDPGVDSVLKVYTLNFAHEIKQFCGIRTSGTLRCSDDSGGSGIANLDIVFLRPDPDPSILSENTTPSYVFVGATITIKSDAEVERTITVASTGQVSVSQ